MTAPLAALDSWLIRTGLRTRSGLNRVHWRLGPAAEGWMALGHETLLWAGRAAGLPYAGAGLEGAAAPPFLKPIYPAPEPLPEIPDRAESGGAGLPRLRGDPESRSWRTPPDWRGSIAEQFLFHTLHPVPALIAAHRRSGNAALLHRAEAIALRWIRECLFRERPAALWDDHITAMRSLALCELWEAERASGEPSRPARRLLPEALLRHAVRLAPEAFYRREHNHGVTQAFALLACALALPGYPRCESWTKLALERLIRQMEENVSPEGVHREHSPYYHFFVFRQLLYADRLARARGRRLPQAYRDRLAAMLAAGARLVKPDGTLVATGDGARRSPVLVDSADLEDADPAAGALLRHRLTGGRRGRAPVPRGLVAPGGGFALLEGGPESARAWHLALRLSTYPTTHIHHDALSFELYAEGDDLLVDSGGPFGYGHPLRAEYFVRTRAHNTVAVDARDQAVGPCRLRRHEQAPGVEMVDAEHELYAGVRHRRMAVFAPPRFLLVADWLIADSPHAYDWRFHLAPGLEAEREGLAVSARRPQGGPGLRLIPVIEEGLSLELTRGGEKPVEGWVCTGDLTKVPVWVARYARPARNATFVCLIVPDSGGPPRDVSGFRVADSAEGCLDASMRLDGIPLRVSVGAEGAARLEEGA